MKHMSRCTKQRKHPKTRLRLPEVPNIQYRVVRVGHHCHYGFFREG